MLFSYVGVASAQAQTIDLRVAPPKISFPEWERKNVEGAHQEFQVRYPSAIKTDVPENDLVPLTIIMPARIDKPVPVVIVLHYWGATDQRVERNQAHDFARRGIASILLPLPYHLARTPAGSRSGERAIVADPKALIETMQQSVSDIRRAIDWIETRPELDAQRIGIAGTSLGALVTTAVVGVEPRIKYAAFALGGVDLADILWRSSRVVKERDQLRNRGYTLSSLREELKPIEPLEYIRDNQLKSSYVVGAKYDTVIPGSATQKLIEALHSPKVIWLDTGHYGGFFVQKKVQQSVSQFFETEFAGNQFIPPKKILAPTIRIGVLADPKDSLQVSVGLDLWRANREGSIFGAALFSPSGARLFTGFRLDKGLNLGVSFSVKSTQPALFWSIVL